MQVNATSACTEIMARVLWHLTFVLCHAAICGNTLLSNNSLDSPFTWFDVDLTPDTFCTTKEEVTFPTWFVSSSVLYSPLTKFTNGESRVPFVLILCSQNGQTLVVQLEERCILEPFTTPGPNVTATQPNTTTSPPLNTTATTTAAADTVATTLTTTTTTANGTVSATPSESPTTTESGLFVSNVWVPHTRNYSIIIVASLWHLF